MAGYSARQSTFTSGDTITAAHSNDEFNQLLAAFNASTGHTHDGTAGDGGPVTTLRDADALNKVLVDTTNNHLEFYVEVSSAAVQQLRIQDGAIVPITDNDIDLGTSSLEFKDLFIDGTANIDAASIDSLALASGATVTAINDEDDMSSNSATSLATQQSIKAYVDSQVTAQDLDLTSDSGTIAIDLDSETLTIQGTSNEIETSASGNALTIGLPNDVTVGNNLTVTGDLTVSGDDITMATNTSGNLLIADGTNFNSVAATSLSEISTIANDDVFLAVDTSGGGLKKVSRSTVVSGLATSAAISNVVEDTTPQLGGNLDVNGNDIVTTSNADIELAPNGTGKVVIKGNTNQGKIVLNCEANSHGQTIIAAPHSESANNVLTLPSTGGDSRLVSATSTATLTNKTLTSPKINEDVVLTSTATELNLVDGITAGTVSASKAVIVDSNKDISGFRNITLSGELDAGSLDVSGDADIDGTLEADAITINGVTLAETISDTVGAMVGSNTETGIAVTYDDSDNTLDFVISALPLSSIDIDGGTDIGAGLTTSDLIIVDDGAGGTNRKAALSRVVTLVQANIDDPTALAIALG